jgi:outer membrane protein TolC
MKRRPGTRLLLTVLLTVAIVLSSPARHLLFAGVPDAGDPQQTASPGTQQTPSNDSSQEAPVMTFGPEGLGVTEAVRLALAHNPDLQLAEATVGQREGEAQEQRGPFDLNLNAVASYTYRVQELTEARKEDERRRRQDLQEGLDATAEARDDAARLIKQLEAVRSAAPGSEQAQRLTEINPVLGTQVQVIDELIASAPPQDRAELIRIRDNFINETVTQVRGELQEQVSEFDRNEQILRNIGEPPTDEVFYDALVRIELSRLFRTGITVTPFVDGTLDGTNFKGKPRSRDFGGKGLEDLYTFRAGADLLVPLGRRRGAAATAAGERAALAELDASRLDLAHEHAVTAFNTVQAYWDLRAAQDAVDVATRSVALHGEVLKATELLVTGGELAKVEEARVRAGASRANARLREAQRTFHEARVQLATVLGIDTTGDESALPRARDAFPRLPDSSALDAWLQGTDTALAQRQDLAAAGRREEAGAILERGAQTDVRPQLDLTASSWYTALAERSASDAIDRWVGPSATFQLEFERPFGNNRAKGRLAAREAERRQFQILVRDTRRQIKLGVVRTVQSLAETLEQARQAEAAVDAYAATINGEVERFRAGEATLIDTLLTEQQRIDAELSYIAARQEAARLVAQIRFETGTLVTRGVAPGLEPLITVPERNRGSRP